MGIYEQQAQKELLKWTRKMRSHPSLADRLSKNVQAKLNSYIPEKIHAAFTTAIRQMVKAVLFGATYTSGSVCQEGSLADREAMVQRKINSYRKTAAAEGAITGAGGILMGLIDFPLLLGIKMKMLFDIAALYGYDVKDYRERLFILQIFQLAFSSQQHRRTVFTQVESWPVYASALPSRLEYFDWRSFQQEYRDYLDLAKLFQLIPGVGAVVGVVVNYRLLNRLGSTAINAYRLRWQQDHLFHH